MSTQSLLVLVALTLSFSGLGLIYRGWKRAHRKSGSLGWALTCAALLAWVPAVGLQYAVVFTLFVPALLVWPFVLAEMSRIAPRASVPRPRQATQWTGKQTAANAAKALVVVLGLPLMAGILTVFVSFQLPLAGASQAAIAIVLLPLLTGLFAALYLMSERRGRWLLAGSMGTAALAGLMYL